MNLEGTRIWLVSRGGERARRYLDDMVEALRAEGADEVDVVGFEGLLRIAAAELGSRAGELLGSAADTLLKTFRLDRFLGGRDEPGEGEKAPGDASESAEQPDLPDLIVVDEPDLVRPLRVVPALRRHPAFTVALIDDFRVDGRWRDVSIDAYVVPHATLLQPHVGRDAQAATRVAGPPVARTYLSTLERDAARADLGLADDQAVVVVAAARMRADLIEKTVFQLTLVEPLPVVLFHHAGDRDRAELLRDVAADYGLPANMFGAATDVGRFYAAADLVLAAADDPELLELLTAGPPVVALGPERGAARTLFLHDHNALTHVEEVAQAGTRIEALLRSGGGPSAQLARPDGTRQVVEALVELYGERKTVPAEPEPEPESPAPAEPGEPAKEAPLAPTVVKGGAFESIGVSPEAARRRPSLPRLTAAQAKDQMAALIIKEREAERALAEAVRARDRWLDRLTLAKDGGDDELAAVAERRLYEARATVDRRNAEIETIRRSKEKLKARVAGSKAPQVAGERSPSHRDYGASDSASAIEARFRRMEIERDMARLRRKLDRGD